MRTLDNWTTPVVSGGEQISRQEAPGLECPLLIKPREEAR